MRRSLFLYIILALCLQSCDSEQSRSAAALVNRVTEGRSKDFTIVVTGEQKEGNDYFRLYSEKDKVVLEGNNGISVASALNYYLKNFCNCHISWCGENISLPSELPIVKDTITKVSPYKYRYYLNYCTFNYTMSWWDEARWQKEIDFMALNGINMPLAVTGQNSVWQRVYHKLGFTDSELESFFSGPAYFNWFWMGNLDGWGGPLTQSFFKQHEKLQHYILKNERSLGMTPVLPAFTGHVPPSFSDKYPDIKVRKTSWVNFPKVTILDPEEKMFDEIGEMFIREQTALYGTDHLYSADTFNENLPPSNDSTFLAGMSSKVFNSMQKADSQAIWVMQGWLFHHDKEFWAEPQIQSLLGAVPDDNMIILDLWSERYPVWSRTNAYYGKPWIWCMLHNFGQNITLSGNVTRVANNPALALSDPAAGNMQGIGLTMEGIEQNPFMYALMFENVWRNTPIDVNEFIERYLCERYGQKSLNAERAWKLMSTTVFENDLTNGGQESIITSRPNFALNPGGTSNTKLHYDPAVLTEAWDLLIESADSLGESDGFCYDLVDITRQVMANYASVLQQNVAKSYQSGDTLLFNEATAKFISYLDNFDTLLATRKEFLLGRWIEDARAMGTNEYESALYVKNARNLLTLWGDKNCRINDYACRQWSGLVSDFYKPRWQKYFAFVSEAMKEGKPIDNSLFKEQIKDWEWNWVCSDNNYSVTPTSNEVEICLHLYNQYRKEIKEYETHK